LGFLAPLFLGGLAILGLPVYVHLLRQYRQKPVPFASLMFFERRTQSSIKHRRLKYLLLFSLRCLFVLLLVLAFARPYFRSATIARASGGRTMVFAVDNSFSMHQGDRFADAKKAALDQINAMRADDRGQVISFGGASKLLTDMTQDKQALRAALAAIEPGDDTSSYAELSRVLRSTSESLKTDIVAHVFTDVQKSSLPPSFSDLRLDDGTKLEIHAVASAPVPNWTVESVEAPRRVFDTKKVRTVATIAGYGTVDAVRKVTLLANGKPLETKQVKVPANGRATVEFLTLDAPYGLTRCEVQIDSADVFPGRPLAVLGRARRPQTGAPRTRRRRHDEPVVCADGARIFVGSRLHAGVFAHKSGGECQCAEICVCDPVRPRHAAAEARRRLGEIRAGWWVCTYDSG